MTTAGTKQQKQDEAQSETSAFNIYLDQAEKLGKVAAIIAALMYLIGVIVSNYYLMSMGVSDFDVFRPKLIMTGAWSLALITASMLPTVGVLYLIGSLLRYKRLRLRDFFAGVTIVLLYFSLHAVVSLLTGADVTHFTHTDISLVIDFLVPTIFVILSFGVKVKGIDIQPHLRIFRAIAAVLLITSTILACHEIAVVNYWVIPESLGGGMPKFASLILNKDGLAFWQQSGAAPLPKDKLNTGTVVIVYRNDHELVVRVPFPEGNTTKKHIVIMSTKLIDGIVPIDPATERHFFSTPVLRE